jgi:alcohol dehydrogenase YqhD (iron-dependent ADH family)
MTYETINEAIVLITAFWTSVGISYRLQECSVMLSYESEISAYKKLMRAYGQGRADSLLA